MKNKKALHALVVTFALLGAASRLSAQERLWYYVDREDSYNDFVSHMLYISVVAPSSYIVQEDGVVFGDVDPKVTELAARNNIKVLPLLVNAPFNKDRLHAFLTNPAAVSRAIKTMVDVSKARNYWGFQIDFENVNIADRDALTAFYRQASQAMHNAGKVISIAIVHRPTEEAGATSYLGWMMSDWRGGYDLKALADASDFVTIMTYSEHTRRTPPGPTASMQWVDANVKYFLQFMPPEKLSLGIGTGGMRWYTSQEDRITPELARSYSTNVSYNWAQHLAERYNAKWIWSEDHQSYYTFYPVGGTFEWIWLEDARSFKAKWDYLKRMKLRGISAWVLGPEDPKMWEVMGR